MPTMNVKLGSGLGVGLGAGVASGVGTGIAVSVFRTRRPDCAKIAAAQIATSVIARLTLTGFEDCKQRIGFFFQERRGMCACIAERILLAAARAASMISLSPLM